jgi:hypothetical protein
MMTKDRANAIMQGAPATDEEKREAEKLLKEAGSSGSNYEGGHWSYPGNSTVAEDKIAELEQKKRMENPIEGASGAIARGNQGDNAIANPDALDTSEVTKVHNVEKAAAQTPDDMNPTAFTSDRQAALEEAGVTQPGETATINKNDSTEDKNSKKRYNQSMMSIWDAYNNGLIDKETAGYFTVDALATLAKNLGRGIGNVGAQFSGGSIDQGHDTSMWEQRKDEIFNQELQGEAEGIQNYANTMKKYNLNKASTINDLLNTVKADVEKLDDNNPAKIAYLALAAQMANGDIDGNTTLAGVGAKAAAPLLEKLEGWLGGKK